MKHSLLPSCGAKKCSSKINEEEGATFNSCFWKLSFPMRRQWLATCLRNRCKKQRKVEIMKVDGDDTYEQPPQAPHPRRSFSRVYSLPLQNVASTRTSTRHEI